MRVRCVVGVLFLIAAAASSVMAAPEPPTDLACASATRAFLATNRAVREGRPDAEDTLRRYLDVDAFAARTFGEQAETLSARALQIVERWLTELYLDGTPINSTLDGELRLVTVKARKKSLRLLWRAGARGPLLIDGGPEQGAMLSERLHRAWKVSGKAPAAFVTKFGAHLERRKQITLSKDNLRSMITLMIVRRVETSWPRYNGKNFVLSLVATNELDRRNPQNLEILFSPADKVLSLEKAGFKRYKDITKKSLKSGLDFSALTSYAGRRNLEREWMITPAQEKVGAPMIADLSFPDLALVGFTNGAVRTMDREALGLGPDDPIVVGDASKSEILKPLSDK